jgi:hypothetical protein
MEKFLSQIIYSVLLFEFCYSKDTNILFFDTPYIMCTILNRTNKKINDNVILLITTRFWGNDLVKIFYFILNKLLNTALITKYFNYF